MKRLIRAFFHAIDGLCIATREEASFCLEIIAAIVAIPTAIALAPDRLSLVLMIAVVLLVLVVELLNTGIEAAIDRMGEEHTPEGKKAKDVGASAVLVSIIIAAIVWGVVLF